MALTIRTSAAIPDLGFSATGEGPILAQVVSPSLEELEQWSVMKTEFTASIVAGYRATAALNLELAEADMQTTLESWPDWE